MQPHENMRSQTWRFFKSFWSWCFVCMKNTKNCLYCVTLSHRPICRAATEGLRLKVENVDFQQCHIPSLQSLRVMIGILKEGMDLINYTVNLGKTYLWTCTCTLFFYIRMLFFRPRLNILILLPILGWKYSCVILKS